MSKTTITLENLVADVIANRAVDGVSQTARHRVNVDRTFMAILKLIAPRIRHFIRQYGLVAHWEDAEQACAIGVHRAIEGYDPEKAQFTTFVNWQLRGELQSLRFRLMTDQRSSAKRVEATTISIQSIAYNNEGDETSFEAMIEDEGALALVEAGASKYLAEAATKALIDEYVEQLRTVGIEQIERRPRAKRAVANRPTEPHHPLPVRMPARLRGLDPAEVGKLEQSLTRNRDLIERRLFDTTTLDQLGSDTGITKERIRQITKRAARTIGELATSHPRFVVMSAQELPCRAPMKRSRPASVATAASHPVSILPILDQPHNRMTKVVAAASGAKASLFGPADSMDGAFVHEIGAAEGNAGMSRGTLAPRAKSPER